MNLFDKFKAYIKQQDLFHPKDKLLLAVSGGVDSVVLCELCKQAGYDFAILHCNFQLRGEESERDESFVKELGVKYGVEVLIERFDTLNYAEEMKLGIQEAARNLRYNWFSKVWIDKNLNTGFNKPNQDTNQVPGWSIDPNAPKWYVITAHHLNDSVETMLMNFFKGTGIKGLQGIQPKHVFFLSSAYLIRPLLFATKEEIIKYAGENNLTFVEDSSNASEKYTRNYFRNKLIPALKEVFPQVEENLKENLHRFNEIEILYRQSIDLHKKKLLEQKGKEIHIPVLKLLKVSALHTIVYEIIKDYGFTAHQVNDTVSLLRSDTGKYISSSTHRILKNRNWLIIAPNENTEAGTIFIEENDKSVEFQQGVISFEMFSTQNSKLKTQNDIAQLNASEIKFPLLLRKWKQGDYFYPLGMTKKKKLSRFFIDQKLSMIQKEKTWVIEMDKKIIWVVGLRIDNRFKITGSTKKILQISLHHR